MKMLSTLRGCLGAAAVGSSLLLFGCGGSGGSPTPIHSGVGSSTAQSQASSGSFTYTSDNYGMENATFLCATNSALGLVLRAAVAAGMTDPDFRTVTRIDITDPSALSAGAPYALGSGTASPFPGNIYFFNGHPSTLLKTVGGSISFNSIGAAGAPISGSFTALVEDDNDPAKPVYTIAASFSFTTESSGLIQPTPVPVPSSAATLYAANCALCHSLGTIDPSTGSGPALSLMGGRLDLLFPAGVAGHSGITLTPSDTSALKILLNVN